MGLYPLATRLTKVTFAINKKTTPPTTKAPACLADMFFSFGGFSFGCFFNILGLFFSGFRLERRENFDSFFSGILVVSETFISDSHSSFSITSEISDFL